MEEWKRQFQLEVEFDAAIDHNDSETVARLLPHVNPATHHNHAIRQASARGYTEIVRILLTDPRVNPASGIPITNTVNSDNESIREASKNGHAGVVRLLLTDPRVNPSSNNNEAIREAARRGHADVYRLLERAGVVYTERIKEHDLRMAVINRNADEVKHLLDLNNYPVGESNIFFRNLYFLNPHKRIRKMLRDYVFNKRRLMIQLSKQIGDQDALKNIMSFMGRRSRTRKTSSRSHSKKRRSIKK